MIRAKLLKKSQELDMVMMAGNARMVKFNSSSDQDEIIKTIYHSIGCIRDSIIYVILAYNEDDAIRYKYDDAYKELIKHWDNFLKFYTRRGGYKTWESANG